MRILRCVSWVGLCVSCVFFFVVVRVKEVVCVVELKVERLMLEKC